MVQFRLNGFCLSFSIRNLFPALFSEGQTSNNITYASLHHKYSRTSVPLIPFMASRPPALNYLNGVFMVIEGCTNLNTVQYSLGNYDLVLKCTYYMHICMYADMLVLCMSGMSLKTGIRLHHQFQVFGSLQKLSIHA